MSHDRGCFKCFDDSKVDCGRTDCPWKITRKTDVTRTRNPFEGRAKKYEVTHDECCVAGCYVKAAFTIDDRHYCRAHAGEKLLDIAFPGE